MTSVIEISGEKPYAIRIGGGLLGDANGLLAPKELKEMGYQWEQPFVADDSAFRAKFGVAPTPVADGARATVEWAKAAFGQK